MSRGQLRAACVLLVGLSLAHAQTAQQALPPAPRDAASLLPAIPHPVFDRVRRTNSLVCGISREEEDYSRVTDHGNRAAFDIDLCKAVSVAVGGPAAQLVLRSFPDEAAALHALRSSQVDLVATASLSLRNTAQDIAFSAPVLLDGQTVLFPNDRRIRTAADLAGRRVCFLTGSAAEEGLHDYASAHGISYTWYPFSEAGEMEAALFTGNCDAVTGDLSSLANIRAIEPQRTAAFTVLADTFRPDPLAVATWAGDPRFTAVVYWTVEALLQAEELKITRGSAAHAAMAQNAAAAQLLGQRFGTGALLGLRDRWIAELLDAVGNYGEIFERDLGAGSRLHLDRGENRPASQGGQLVAIPLRDR